MRRLWFPAIVLTVVLVAMSSGKQPDTSPKTQTSATGVLLGRSGKPMANAHVFLGKIEDDADVLQARVKLGGLPIAQTDAKGQFQLSGFAPGYYTILYAPSGSPSIVPAEISIKALQAVTRSILPGVKNVEIGTTQPLDERRWGATLTLLKGHTFWGDGTNMKIWNATLRRGPSGPYLEVRRGSIWQADLNDKTRIKLDAWSF